MPCTIGMNTEQFRSALQDDLNEFLNEWRNFAPNMTEVHWREQFIAWLSSRPVQILEEKEAA